VTASEHTASLVDEHPDAPVARAWIVWGTAATVYVLAILHRSSLGVAGLVAADRFSIRATELAAFTVLQMAVYAGMQVPVGVLLDRFGSRRMLLSGLVLMTAGQLLFAFSDSFLPALAARTVLGAGDAMVFISVIRLVAAWFSERRGPVVVQLSGQVGQLGAVLAAAPLSLMLESRGWTPTFAAVSCLGVVLLVAVAVLVRDSPSADREVVRTRLAALVRSLQWVWGNPGTRLGMWSHFVSQFPATLLALMWGYPFLVRGQGLSSEWASALLTVMTAVMFVTGPLLGRLTASHPFHRSHLVLSVVAAIVALWTVVLAWPGRAPLWVLLALFAVTAVGGPVSMIGFDLARTFVPAEAMGRANGLVNGGGFAASLLAMGLVGVGLDAVEPRGAAAYDLGDFRVAMCALYPFWALGTVQVLRYRRRAILHLRRVHPGAVEQLQRGEPFTHPGFHDREGV
jgi:sugar phosphate permease